MLNDELADKQDSSDSESFDYSDFGNLEAIFADDEAQEDEVTNRSEDIILEDETIYPAEVREKPIRDKPKEVNPFGDFG